MQGEIFIFIGILIFSVIVHEISHGYIAEMLGDPTPRLAGRLTLNPLPHIDPFGSVILPLLLALTGTGVIFGWAKPVPINPYNLSNQKYGGAMVAVAGPASNILLAIVFAILIRLAPLVSPSPFVVEIFGMVVLVNIVLAIFNLIPIPPLDGHHILFAVLGHRANNFKRFLIQYQWVLIIVFIFFLWQFLAPVIFYIYNLLV